MWRKGEGGRSILVVMPTRRDLLKTAALAPFALTSRASRASAATAAPGPIRFAVSTYSYWHFEEQKYPVQKVIEQAADIGFEGVELLHVQMDNETPAYLNQLKQAAFRRGLALPMLSIHQDFVSPDAKERQEAIDHTKKCIGLAARLGIPAVRLNSGRWNTIKSFDDLMKAKGDEPPIQGYTDEDAFKWCVECIRACLPDAETAGVVLALENHWGLSTRVENLLKIYKDVNSPWLGINLDTGNWPGDPYEGIAALAPYADDRPGEDVLRRRRLVHARSRLPAHREDPEGRRLQGLDLARDGRQGAGGYGRAQEPRSAADRVRLECAGVAQVFRPALEMEQGLKLCSTRKKPCSIPSPAHERTRPNSCSPMPMFLDTGRERSSAACRPPC